MATVIDSLVVLLNLDPKNFTEGQRDAIKSLLEFQRAAEKADAAEKKREDQLAETMRNWRREQDKARADEERKVRDTARAKEKAETEAAKRQGEAYTLAKEAALGFGAALAALGVERLVQGVSQSVAQVGLLSKNLDSTTPAVVAWGRAVEKSVGGSAEAAAGTLQGITQALIHMRTNLSGDNPLFYLSQQLSNYSKSRRPFNFMGPDGKPLDAEGILSEIASYAPEMDRAQYSTLLADANIDPGTANFLAQGPKGVQAALEWQRKNGLPTDDQAKQALKVVDAEKGLAQALDNLKNNLVLSFGPDIERFLKDFTSLIQFVSQNIDFTELKRQRAQHWHEAEVETLVNRGMTPEAAEKAATEADAKGIDATSGLTPRKIVSKLASAARSFIRDKGWLQADIEEEVEKDAKKHGLDPTIMKAIYAVEGGGYNRVSPKGAFGPSQLMPGTAADLGVPTSPYDPNYSWQQNIDAGMGLFAQLLTRSKGSYQIAAAGFNAGLNNKGVQKYIKTGDPLDLPTETTNYLNSISALLPAGFFMPPVIGYHDPTVTGGGGGSSTTNSSEVHIGQVNVHGVNTNSAHSVAAGMQAAVRLHPLVAQADAGLF